MTDQPIASPVAGARAGYPGRASPLLRMARREPGLLLGLALLGAIALIALFPSLFAHGSPYTIDTSAALQPPSAAHWFGTDDTGRDLFARVIHGTRVTLAICGGSLLISAAIGGGLGLLSGFAGGWADQALGRFVDVLLSFPPIILGVIITGVLGSATPNLILALSIVYMPVFFRIARAGALSEKEKTYVEAARSVGLGAGTVLRRHIARNVMPLVLMQYIILFPLILQIEAALGFLGLGVQPPAPDWGAILEQGKDYILQAPWISIFPGLAILLAALALMLVGLALQKRIDHR
jgi:peptide/nickel transport system permease protein